MWIPFPPPAGCALGARKGYLLPPGDAAPPAPRQQAGADAASTQGLRGGQTRRQIPRTSHSRTPHTNLPELAGPQASRSRVPSTPSPSAKPLLPQTPKEAELPSFFNERRRVERSLPDVHLRRMSPRTRSQSAARQAHRFKTTFPMKL